MSKPTPTPAERLKRAVKVLNKEMDELIAGGPGPSAGISVVAMSMARNGLLGVIEVVEGMQSAQKPVPVTKSKRKKK